MKWLLLILTAFVSAAVYGKPVTAWHNDTIRISMDRTVHIRFASELKYVSLSDRAIVAKIVESSKDIVAIKAACAFGHTGSVSCLEANGKMHSFIVIYDEKTEELVVDTRYSGNYSDESIAEIAEYGKELYHLGCSGYGISLQCDNILIRNDMLFVVLEVRNSSPVSYGISQPRFAVESRKKTKRALFYERAVVPKSVYGLSAVGADSSVKVVFGFDKLTLVKGQVLRVYLYENGGARNFVLTLNVNDINRARKI